MPQFSTLIGLNRFGSRDQSEGDFKCGWGPEVILIFMLEVIGEAVFTTTGMAGVGIDGVDKVVFWTGGVVWITTWGGFPVNTEGSICSAWNK